MIGPARHSLHTDSVVGTVFQVESCFVRVHWLGHWLSNNSQSASLSSCEAELYALQMVASESVACINFCHRVYTGIGSRKGRDYTCLRVFDPSIGKVRFFRSSVLPFGAIRSLHAFLRLSRALWWIGVAGCKLLWASFYDDFFLPQAQLGHQH